MNRNKHATKIVLVILVVLNSFPVWLFYCALHQQRKDNAVSKTVGLTQTPKTDYHSKNLALIAAIKAGDNRETLKLLVEGASGEAQDTNQPPSGDFVDTLHLPALLVLYNQVLGTMPDSGPGPSLTVIRALLDHGAKVNDRGEEEWSPLSEAARFSNGDTVRLLLARGADIEAKDSSGYTPLMMATAVSAKILLEHGANIEARGNDRETPLIYNARHGEAEVVQVLLEHGAKVSNKDTQGCDALFYVSNSPEPVDKKIQALLRQHGAK